LYNGRNSRAQKIFSKEECEKIINSPSQLITEDSKEAIEQNKKHHGTYGNYPAKILDDDTWVRNRIETYVGIVNQKYFNTLYNGVQDYIGIKEYNINDDCEWHTDVLNGNRRLGVIIPLSLECEGGDFEFFQGEVFKVKQEVGVAIVFPIFLYHRVTPITKGKRIALITWTTGEELNW